MTLQRIDTDVAVVGAGLAGLRGAIAATDLGLRVAVVSKTEPGLMNCSAAAVGYFSGAVGGRSPEEYLDTLKEHDAGRADPQLQRILAFESGPALQEMINRFGIDARVERGTVVSEGPLRWWGKAYMEPLLATARDRGVQFIAPACADRLLVADGECCGVRALALDSGDTLNIRARGVLLAGGGHSGIYLRHDNPGRTTGDCLALADEAAVPLRDMEFLKLHPIGLAEGEWGDLTSFGAVLRAGRLQLADGTDISRAKLMDLWQTRAQSLDRNDQRFDAFVDLSGVDWSDEDLSEIREVLLSDLPVDRRPLRISPLAHYTTGGITIGPHGRTALPYLFAAGECTGGVFGANRPGGAALTDCVVFGRRAGAELGRRAKARAAMPELSVEPIDLSGSFEPHGALREARALLWNYASVAPTAPGLQRCRQDLCGLEQETQGHRAGSAESWMALHELHCVIRIGKCVIKSKMVAGM